MRIRYLKLKNWLLVTLMGVLGFSGCKTVKDTTIEPEKEKPPVPRMNRDIRLMYGVPTMNYMVHGQVRNESGEPLSSIRINMLEPNMQITGDSIHGDPERVEQYLESTAIQTDEKGMFGIDINQGQAQTQVRILVRDADGDTNGSYKNQVLNINVTPENLDRSDANGMHQGTFHQTLDIKLESKE